MMMRRLTTLAEPATCVLRGRSAANRVFFRGGWGVGGFVDSGPKTLVPSASNRSTAEWTLVDSGAETLVPWASNRSTRVDSLLTPAMSDSTFAPGLFRQQRRAKIGGSL